MAREGAWQEEHAWQGVCMVGGMHGRGGDMHGRGMCVVGA